MSKKYISLNNLLLFVFSFIFAGVIQLTVLLYPLSSIDETSSWNMTLNYFSFTNVICLIIITMIIYVILHFFLHSIKCPREESKVNTVISPMTISKITFLMCLISWGTSFLVYFPGATLNDVINGMMSPTASAGFQPYWYQSYIYYMMKLGSAIFQSSITAFAIMVIIQVLMGSFVIAYCSYWIAAKDINKYLVYAFTIVFSFIPMFSNFSIALVKDVPFAYAIILYLTAIFDLINGYDLNHLQRILYIISCFFIWFVRPNGKYVIVIMSVMLLFYRKISEKTKKLIIGALIAILIVHALSNTILDHQLVNQDLLPYSAKEVTMREMSSSLINQIAAVIYNDGNISEDDLTFLDNLCPMEIWKSGYRLSWIDPIKFDPQFDNDYLNAHKMDFIKTWFSVFIKNPRICIRSYLIHTYGLWSLSFNNIIDISQSIYTNVNNNTEANSLWGEYLSSIGLENKMILPESIYQDLNQYYIQSCTFFIRILSCGKMIWLILLCALIIFIRSECKNYLLVFLPTMMLYASELIADAITYGYRYHLYMLYSLPLLIIITILSIKNSIPVNCMTSRKNAS